MIREPAFAGQFYPKSASELRSMIKSFVKKDAEKVDVIGLVAPHAGYIYSGAVTGEVLSRIKFKDTFIMLGTNHTGLGNPFGIMTEGSWKTPLGEVQINSELAKKLLSVSRYLGEDNEVHQSEHSIEVQLPFLQYFKPDVKIVPIMISPAIGENLREIGRQIAWAVRDYKQDVIIFASSDMNHYEPQNTAKKKDNQAIEAMLNLDPDELLRRVGQLDISMCGYAAAAVMLVAAKELGAGQAELVKYQTSGDVSGDYNAVVGYAGIIVRKLSPLAKLAKDALESYVTDRQIFQPKVITPEMQQRAGTFVCIKKAGELRGCIGTFEPTRENVALEVIYNAVSTATQDPRFQPVQPGELKDLEYTVDVLTEPEPIESQDQLDPKKYGVIVESGFRRGLLLPDLEGVDTADYQVKIARQKAGIDPGEPVKLYRFEVKRYK